MPPSDTQITFLVTRYRPLALQCLGNLKLRCKPESTSTSRGKLTSQILAASLHRAEDLIQDVTSTRQQIHELLSSWQLTRHSQCPSTCPMIESTMQPSGTFQYKPSRTC